MKRLLSWAVGLTIGLFSIPTSAWSQSVTFADDGTGTVVDTTGNQYDISGGTQAEANLFHSFEKLGLSEGEIANFLSNPDIENILGRVTGGDASFINGLIQVSGSDANLFLMNPAGIIFGENAQLNVPADFNATTANAIGIDQDWFRSLGSNDYGALTGEPETFAFATDSSGTIVNAGNLSVDAGQQIQLVGGLVVNTGTLSTPGGNITVEAVPGEGLVTVTQAGNLLSLGLPVATEAAVSEGSIAVPQTLPQLLSRAEAGSATGISVDGEVVRLTRADVVIPTDVGVAIASGTLDVSNSDAGLGGTVDVLGEQVALVDAQIEASGVEGGGDVRIGGDYRGEGSVPNALRTYVDGESSISANAFEREDGGRIILWSDEATSFYGSIDAKGGAQAGDGGFVEVSSLDSLVFRGTVEVEAAQGEGGTLLLDPKTIQIVDSTDGSGSLDDELTPGSDREVLAAVPDDGENTISVAQLEAFGDGSNIVIEADDGITIGLIDDGELNLSSANGSVTFRADANEDGDGDFTIEADQQGRRASILGERDERSVGIAGSVNISGVSINVGDISSQGLEITSIDGNISAGKLRIIPIQDTTTPDEDTSTNSISLVAKQGNITVETIIIRSLNQSGLSELLVESGGFFRATGIIGTNESGFVGSTGFGLDEGTGFTISTDIYIPTSIFVEGRALRGGVISIRHGSRNFSIGPRLNRDNEGKIAFRELPFLNDSLTDFFDSDGNLNIGEPIDTPEGFDEETLSSNVPFASESKNFVSQVIFDSRLNRSLSDNDSFTAGAISLGSSSNSGQSTATNSRTLTGAGSTGFNSGFGNVEITSELDNPDVSGLDNTISTQERRTEKVCSISANESEVAVSQSLSRSISEGNDCLKDQPEDNLLEVAEDINY